MEGARLDRFHWFRRPVIHTGPQRHDWHEIIAVQRGRYSVELGGRRLVGEPGCIIHIPAGASHESSADPDLHFAVVIYHDDRHDLVARRRNFLRDSHATFSALLESLRRVHPADNEREREGISALLESFLFMLEKPETDRHADMIELVDRYLWADYAKHIYLEQIASFCRLSPSQLNRRYRALTGTTPMRRLAEIRAEVARKLYAQTDEPAKAIAHRVGLGGPTQLYRLIRQQFGCRPEELRR